MLLSRKRLHRIKKTKSQTMKNTKGGRRKKNKKNKSFSKKKKSFNLRNKSLKRLKGGNGNPKGMKFFFLAPIEVRENGTDFALIGIKNKKQANQIKRKFAKAFTDGFTQHISTTVLNELKTKDEHEGYTKLHLYSLERMGFDETLIKEEIKMLQALNHRLFHLQIEINNEISIANRTAHQQAKKSNNGNDPCGTHRNKSICNSPANSPCNWSTKHNECRTGIPKGTINIYENIKSVIEGHLRGDVDAGKTAGLPIQPIPVQKLDVITPEVIDTIDPIGPIGPIGPEEMKDLDPIPMNQKDCPENTRFYKERCMSPVEFSAAKKEEGKAVRDAREAKRNENQGDVEVGDIFKGDTPESQVDCPPNTRFYKERCMSPVEFSAAKKEEGKAVRDAREAKRNENQGDVEVGDIFKGDTPAEQPQENKGDTPVAPVVVQPGENKGDDDVQFDPNNLPVAPTDERLELKKRFVVKQNINKNGNEIYLSEEWDLKFNLANNNWIVATAGGREIPFDQENINETIRSGIDYPFYRSNNVLPSETEELSQVFIYGPFNSQAEANHIRDTMQRNHEESKRMINNLPEAPSNDIPVTPPEF